MRLLPRATLTVVWSGAAEPSSRLSATAGRKKTTEAAAVWG